MRTLIIFAAVLVLLAHRTAAATEAPFTYTRVDTKTDVEADGRFVQTSDIQIRANNKGAAQGLAQQGIPYSEALQSLDILEAATIKANGERLPVDLSTVTTQLQPGVGNTPLYTDLKRKVVIFPNVDAGDSIYIRWRLHMTKPLFPGRFSSMRSFAKTSAFLENTTLIRTPATMPLSVEAHGVDVTTEEEPDGSHVYRWNYKADAVAEDPSVLLPQDRVPRVFVSSFPDWEAMGHQWADMVADKADVTPSIQALADRLTAGVTDQRETVRLLYDWVSTHVRWVAIYIGNGSIIPHKADAVLANGYGDCKDQVMLLVALLHAKGIVAVPVLINIGNTFTLPGPPVIEAFNHCITFVPSQDLYLDTTVGGAPFGTLPFSDYNKPVVHAVAAGAVLHKTPAVPDGVATASLRTTMQINNDGSVTGESVTTATGPFATQLRAQANRAQVTGTERWAAELIRERDGRGTGTATLDPLDVVSDTYHISGHFDLGDQSDWLEGESFVVPTGLRVLGRPGDLLAGPINMRNLPETEPTPCYAGREDEEMKLILPSGRAPEKLPKDRNITGDGFSYVSEYGFADGAITVHRVFTSHFQGPLCSGEQRVAVAKALHAIRHDLDGRVELKE